MNKAAQKRITIEKIEKTKKLDLSGFNLTEIPKEIAKMTWLSSLKINSNQIRDLKNLPPNLEFLYINANQIRRLENLPIDLITLDIANNQISQLRDLPPDLVKLNIASNQIKRLENLPASLKTLYISFNEIAALEGLPKSLKKMDIRSNRIDRFTNKFSPNLHYLDIRSNNIQKLENLPTTLKNLDIRSNKIKQLENLPEKLATLKISSNQIQVLENLPLSLEELDIASNIIEELAALPPKLTVLSIDFNKISQLKNLPKTLMYLSIASNRIKALEHLPENLKKLDIRSNQIEDLKPIFDFIQKEIPIKWEWEAEDSFYFEDNPLVHPPIETIKQGNQAIIRYFEELERSGEEELFEAKLLIVGQGGSGKTSLKRKLQAFDAEMPESKDTTRGIDIETYHCEIEKGKKFQIHIWDFGGQNIQHYAHQFFLTGSSLYVLLTNERKQDSHLQYWLNIIQMLGKNSPVLLVQNEIEGHIEPLEKAAAIRERFKNVVSPFHQVNIKEAATDKRFGVLKDEVIHQALKLPHVGKIFPSSFVKVKEKISKLANNKHFITWNHFQELCREEGVKNPELIADYARTFTFLGTCLHFENDLSLRNTVFLRPKWIIDALFELLYHELIKEQKGVFSEMDMVAIWRNGTYADMHGKLLRLMENFELCYRIKDSKKFIVPQRLPAAEAYNWKEKETSKLIYDYNFMPKGIITRLICRLHESLEKDAAWCDAFVLKEDKSRAFVKEVYSEDQILIEVTGKKRALLLNKIINELDSIHKDSKYSNMEVKKLIACSCTQCKKETGKLHYFSYIFLHKLVNRGVSQIHCEKSADPIDIQELLNLSGIQENKTGELKEIKNLVKKNKIAAALEIMLKCAKTVDLKDQVIMINRQFSDNAQKREKDILSNEELNLEDNKITDSMLSLIKEIFKKG